MDFFFWKLLSFFSKGDPDVRGNDGVYSRYFTDFQAGEGRYDIQIHVDNYRGTAYTYQPKIFKGKGTKISIKGYSKWNVSTTFCKLKIKE